MNAVVIATLGLLTVAGLLTLGRLIAGPSALDRILAVDVLVVLAVSGIAADTVRGGGQLRVPLLVVVALLGFMSTVTAARFAERGAS